MLIVNFTGAVHDEGVRIIDPLCHGDLFDIFSAMVIEKICFELEKIDFFYFHEIFLTMNLHISEEERVA